MQFYMNLQAGVFLLVNALKIHLMLDGFEPHVLCCFLCTYDNIRGGRLVGITHVPWRNINASIELKVTTNLVQTGIKVSIGHG